MLSKIFVSNNRYRTYFIISMGKYFWYIRWVRYISFSFFLSVLLQVYLHTSPTFVYMYTLCMYYRREMDRQGFWPIGLQCFWMYRKQNINGQIGHCSSNWHWFHIKFTKRERVVMFMHSKYNCPLRFKMLIDSVINYVIDGKNFAQRNEKVKI